MIRRRVAPDGACLFHSIHLLTSIDDDENVNAAQSLREHCAKTIRDDSGEHLTHTRIMLTPTCCCYCAKLELYEGTGTGTRTRMWYEYEDYLFLTPLSVPTPYEIYIL